MKIKIKDRNFSIALLVLFVIYILFAISDLSTSRQSGYRSADRSDAHRYLILLTSYLFVYAVFNIKKVKFQQPLISLILLSVWTIFVNILNNVSVWVLLVQSNMSVLWCLSYIFFNTLRVKESKYKSSIEIFSRLLLWCYILATVYYFFDMMARIGRIPVLNLVYYEMALLPWVFVAGIKKNEKWIYYLASIAVVILSMKRGAIFAMALMILADSYVTAKQTNSYKMFVRIVVIVVMFAITVFLADNISDGFLSHRFSEDELESGSGRMEHFSITWRYIKDGDLWELMFGRGCEKSLQMFGILIHNEWLYFLFCYGLIGLMIYASLIGSFVKKSILELKKKSYLAIPCFIMTALYLVLSMVSAGYSGYVGLWLFGFWGYLNAELDSQNNRLLIGENTNETM